MKVKLANLEHAAGMLDPQTRRSPFIVPGTDDKPATVVAIADVPDNSHWVRRTRASGHNDAELWLHDGDGFTRHLSDGSTVRETVGGQPTVREFTTPVGNEPIAPLTTRG